MEPSSFWSNQVKHKISPSLSHSGHWGWREQPPILWERTEWPLPTVVQAPHSPLGWELCSRSPVRTGFGW